MDLGVLEKLNTMELEKVPRIIILSAVGQDKITQQAITLGADYYTVKPFDMEVFTKRIREMFNGTPMQRYKYKNFISNIINDIFKVKQDKSTYGFRNRNN